MRPSLDGRSHDRVRGQGETHTERHGSQQHGHDGHDSHHGSHYKCGDAVDEKDSDRKMIASSDPQQGHPAGDGASWDPQRIAGVVSLTTLIFAWVAQSEVSYW